MSGLPPFRYETKTSGLAITSLVLGILSLTCLSIFAGVPGIICGHWSLGRIRRSDGALTGGGLAIAGLVTSYLSLLVLAALLPIAIPNFIKARNTAMTNTCMNNLRQIDVAKNQWALDHRKNTGEVPSLENLKPYFKDHIVPACPADGVYTIGAIGENPTCSVPGHQILPVVGVAAPPPQIVIHTGNTVKTATTPPAALAVPANGFIVPAPRHSDMVHDPKRNVLYISAGDVVLRYQMSSKAFLPPLALGGELRGVDLSPDNGLLAVADASDNHGTIGIHLVDLQSESDIHVTFPSERYEGGTHSVAFGADGAVWITSTFHGSGDIPLRKYSPATKQLVAVGRVGQNTTLMASANREFIAFAEPDNSAGYYGRFNCRATTLPSPLRANASLYQVGINRDGSQWAAPTFGSLFLAGASVPKLGEKEVLDVAYHPLRDFLFVSRAGTSTIAVYETAGYTKVKELDCDTRFEWTENLTRQQGRLRLSSDGKYLFCAVNGGVRCLETGL